MKYSFITMFCQFLLYNKVKQLSLHFSSVTHSCQIHTTQWTAACQASLSITNSQCLLRLMSIESVMPFNHLILCCPVILLPSIFPSTRVFSMSQFFASGGQDTGFSFGISPSNESSRLISFTIDWFDPLAVQGTLMSLVQHHSSKASIHPQSPFFMVQLSHRYMTTGKTIPLTI